MPFGHYEGMNIISMTVRRAAALAAIGTSLVVVVAGSPALAQSTTITTKTPGSNLFCAQLRVSQTALAAATSSGAAMYQTVATEWAKIAKVAPAAIKSNVTVIQAAYASAAASPTTAAATLKTLGAASKAVTDFSTQNCPANRGGDDGDGGPGGPGDGGPGGPGGPRRFDPNDPQFKAFSDCLTKQGVTLGGGQADGGRGGGGQDGGAPDAKRQAAIQACQAKLPAVAQGGFGGPGGRGFGGGGLGAIANSPELQACLKANGVTAPSAPAPGATSRSAQDRNFGDPKFRTALNACRAKLGLATGGTGRRGGAAVGPTTSLAKI